MTEEPINEFDLLAYADCLLDHDPRRKAVVEAAMRSSPDLAEKVRSLCASTEALRSAYQPKIHEPVPERLYAALDRRDRASTLHFALRAAAVCALVAGSVASGWLGAHLDASSPRIDTELVGQSYANLDAPAAAAINDRNTAAISAPGTRPISWLANGFSLTSRAPDLSALGYSLVDRETIASEDGRTVRLSYSGEKGTSFALFLRPRARSRNIDVHLTRQGDIAVAHWLDGPVASAIAARLPDEETLAIAKAVRKAMNQPYAPAYPVPDGFEDSPAALSENIAPGAAPLQDDGRLRPQKMHQ